MGENNTWERDPEPVDHADDPVEAADEQAAGETEGSASPRGYEPTGNPTVDSVLESLSRLDDAPVSEHVEVFESAHEKLRAALADAGNDDPPA